MYESIANNNSLITNFPNFPFSGFIKFSDIAISGLFVANWLYPFYHLQSLPSSIPLAYTFNGNTLLFGKKILIFTLPMIGSIWLANLYRYAKSPENLNYPFKVTERNYTKVYEWAKSLCRMTGLLSQVSILAHSMFVLLGRDTNRATRSKWIQNGTIGLAVCSAIGFGGLYYILKQYIIDKKETIEAPTVEEPYK